jgi:hypothetical protein
MEDSMNRTLVVIVALTVLLIGSVASVSAFPRLRVNIPFDFHAGNQIIPAGEYLMEFRSAGASATGSTLYILNRDRVVVHIMPAVPGTRTHVTDNFVLFNRYGENYFLAKACQGSYEATTPRSGKERELAIAYARSLRSKTVVVAAGR